MGGSQAKQDVGGKKQIKNYMEDTKVKQTAQAAGIDPSLVAYAEQKNDKVANDNLISQRS